MPSTAPPKIAWGEPRSAMHDGVVAQAPARCDDEPFGLRAHSTIRGSRRTYSRSAIRFASTIDVVVITRNAPCSIG